MIYYESEEIIWANGKRLEMIIQMELKTELLLIKKTEKYGFRIVIDEEN